ncbi:hypothetical protein OUZ56_022746 [Daphnia magna]|uniref:Uncharacterized protein n=1 Tax=Daphnia magna TaxID=35525 RepID=A0ABR0AXE0_9CRUS|nr:hypothetical protein OUZ56_022746 [Daphnia magna]
MTHTFPSANSLAITFVSHRVAQSETMPEQLGLRIPSCVGGKTKVFLYSQFIIGNRVKLGTVHRTAPLFKY